MSGSEAPSHCAVLVTFRFASFLGLPSAAVLDVCHHDSSAFYVFFFPVETC